MRLKNNIARHRAAAVFRRFLEDCFHSRCSHFISPRPLRCERGGGRVVRIARVHLALILVSEASNPSAHSEKARQHGVYTAYFVRCI